MRLEICPAAARFSLAVRWISLEKRAVQKISRQWNLHGLITDCRLFIQFNSASTVLIIGKKIFTADA